MTYEQYWYGDSSLCKSYYEAERLRQEKENYTAWLNGAYVCRALRATVVNMFADKNADRVEYPTEPIGLKRREETEAEKQKREEEEASFAEAWMSNLLVAGKDWGKHEQTTAPEA